MRSTKTEKVDLYTSIYNKLFSGDFSDYFLQSLALSDQTASERKYLHTNKLSKRIITFCENNSFIGKETRKKMKKKI